MTREELPFDYEAHIELNGRQIYMTDDAVPEDIAIGNGSKIVSNAYCGIRIIADNCETNDFEVYGRVGANCVDIIGTDSEWEEVELPVSLFADNSVEVLSAISKVIFQPTTR